MFERKIYYKLLDGKNNVQKKCLIVKGARRVGKTYVIDKFARENYKNYVYINFFEKLETVPDVMHNKMMELFKEYIIVGGMPSVVKEFVSSHNFNNVIKIQKNILEDYKMDIGKYTKESEKVKIRDCFLSIPKHLSKDYKKFRYALVSSGGKAEKYVVLCGFMMRI